jgi:hypothetical protein
VESRRWLGRRTGAGGSGDVEAGGRSGDGDLGGEEVISMVVRGGGQEAMFTAVERSALGWDVMVE